MISPRIYSERRNILCNTVKDGVVLMLANDEQARNFPSNIFDFRQDSTFLYYTGISKPGLALLLIPEEGTSVLFGDDPSIETIIWSGKGVGINEMAEQAGIEKTESYGRLGEYVNSYMKKGHKIHFFSPYQTSVLGKLAGLLQMSPMGIGAHQSEILIKAIVAQREIKDDFEIKDMEQTLKVGTRKMFKNIHNMAVEGEKEKNILAKITQTCLEYGNGMAFAPILSVNGDILHNPWYKNELKQGQLFIADAGVESTLGYATDITRTYPVNGKFNSLQKDIYNIVLQTLKKSISLIKPGVAYKDVHYQCCLTMVDRLKEIELLSGDREDIVMAGAHALFFPHGLGHMMGLDVHDMENLGEDYVGYDAEVQRSDQFGTAYLRLGKKLKENMVLTVEPGIYFIWPLIEKWKSEKKHLDMIRYDKLEKYRDFGGIRIEDDVVVRQDGCRVMSEIIPRDIADIEK